MTHEQQMAAARAWSVERSRPAATDEVTFTIDSYGATYSITRRWMSPLRYRLWLARHPWQSHDRRPFNAAVQWLAGKTGKAWPVSWLKAASDLDWRQ